MNSFTLITILEILCINTYTTYKCSKRRKSKLTTLLLLYAVSIVITALLYPLLKLLPDMDKGSGLFMLFWFLYAIPLYFIFDRPMKQLMIVMSSSWIYTMLAYSFSFRAASLYPTGNIGLPVVIVQTVFFILTLPYYIKLVNKILVNILKYIDNKTVNTLLAISLFWFFTIFLVNYIIAEGNNRVLDLVILFVIAINTILTYKLFYKLVSLNTKAKELSHITKIDILTQLKNREGFYEDVQQKIYGRQSFSIIFVDLDNFKSVNDKYGHDAGDLYLLEFVKAVKSILKDGAGFYRLHGDEFVCLTGSQEVSALCKGLEKLRFAGSSRSPAFKGLSLGSASYPLDSEELSQLLYLADLRMYQRKKEKHRI